MNRPADRPPRSEGAPGSGRRVAAKVLFRVAKEGAWASRALDAELDRARLSPPEGGRAADLVYGSLRALRSIDATIAGKASRAQAIEPLAHAVMRVAVFELLHTGAASHAIVSEAVGVVKKERGEGLSRFVNAVLRAVAKDRPASPRERTLDLPPWVSRELERSFGAARAATFAEAAAEVPPLGLRAYGRDVATLERELAAARPGAELWASPLSTRALWARGVGDVRILPGYLAGHFAGQDAGSQRVAELVEAQPGDVVLDACAGRGGKTCVLAEAVGPTGRVVATDLHDTKLEAIAGELSRLGLRTPLETRTLDLSVGHGKLERVFSRALVDAPCTGLGTLRRRPEILLRLAEADPERMASLQLGIVGNVVPLLVPGGVLVVATCSFAAAEGPGLAARIDAAWPSLERLPVPGQDDDGVTRLGPFVDRGADAYQIVRWRVRS